ncbi:MAG: hypothetical protein Q4D45_09055 [Lachnospiraceae bacterium]|nr:hypothetical protein [Lachnospiraceae bacterium]
MKKTIIILCFIISLLASFTVASANDTVMKTKIGNEEIIRINMDSLKLSESSKTEWDKRLAINKL